MEARPNWCSQLLPLGYLLTAVPEGIAAYLVVVAAKAKGADVAPYGRALLVGGVLAAVLYSGKVIGDAEKQAALAFFKALPLTQYTVLVCEFANWAQTAPLPCFVIKK